MHFYDNVGLLLNRTVCRLTVSDAFGTGRIGKKSELVSLLQTHESDALDMMDSGIDVGNDG